ncbi:MAG TPA: malonic semialdehyde reductase [Pseudobdellovibrionaceae bacterium]|nr:malonic semialdehyde reductase [Pseudobdellovibrionaceae bacterium]
MPQISQDSLDQIFLRARTHKNWQDRRVEPETLHEIYDLMKWGPTAGNCCPLRILFLTTPESKDRLLPCLDQGNVEKTRTAPVTAVLAQDMRFFERLTKLAPHMKDPTASYEGKDSLIENTAFRNSSLQGAYFMIAARALGLDCGPMSGFDDKKVDETFFAGTSWKSNFVCNLGYGIPEKLFPRAPRLDFEEACKIL